MTEEHIKSFFVQALGASPMVRVVDYLLANRAYDFSRGEVTEGSGVSKVTLEGIWHNLVALDMILPTRKIGKAQLYMINPDSVLMQKFAEVDDYLTNIGTEKVLAEELGQRQPVRVPVSMSA